MFGYMGLSNMAIGGLTGLSGYISTYMVMRANMSFWIALPLASLFVAAVGVCLAFPAIRIKGLYFKISTMLIQLLLTQLFLSWDDFTLGDVGISNIPTPTISLGSSVFSLSGAVFSYLATMMLIIYVMVAKRMTTGRTGLRVVATRDDEVLASYLGIDVTKQRILMFFLTSFMAGVYGCLCTPLITFISPRQNDLSLSFNTMVMVVFGGQGTLWGPVLGAAILTILPNVLSVIYPFRNYITGLTLIATIILFPKGLIGIFGLAAKKLKSPQTSEGNQQRKS
jgi:branched-chain amino acid transport system permease protein